jgi:hypothetical protein
MKQTAVEWLIEKMQNQIDAGYGFNPKYEEALVNQAKEMEKQQIIDAHGKKTKQSRGISNYTYILTGEEYYNETFKK